MRFPGLTCPCLVCAADADADEPERASATQRTDDLDELAALLAGARVNDAAAEPATPEKGAAAAAAADAAAAPPSSSAKFAAFRAEQRGALRYGAAARWGTLDSAPTTAQKCCAHHRDTAERAQAANAAAEAAAAAEAEEAAAEAAQAIADAKAYSKSGGAPRVGLIHSADLELHKGPDECVHVLLPSRPFTLALTRFAAVCLAQSPRVSGAPLLRRQGV